MDIKEAPEPTFFFRAIKIGPVGNRKQTTFFLGLYMLYVLKNSSEDNIEIKRLMMLQIAVLYFQ